ncbi:SGNH/GDSL hydrolase family protein [Actinomadura atramentaria]|uniref:SGNH/GDSL hydrolase family protein n=1 Tax=Actinomadura atramentaria TaxID=1990 RepID=UPI0003605465|nr:SGNH/GDSL hydrolase family protein [Actinomadura atramentaria]
MHLRPLSALSPVLRRSATAAVAAAAATAALAVPARADAPPAYVALGDSMASGPLVPDITGPLACGRSTRNYAHLLAARFSAAPFTDVTCSGADTGDLVNPQHLSLAGVDAGTAPAQFDALSASTTLVTLTIGGNDAGLVGVAQKCVQLNPFAAPCKDAYTAGGVDQVSQRVQAFGPELATSLETLHARAPHARVVVTGYGLYIKAGGCWPTQPWLAPDADYLQAKVNELNGVIAAQAAAHGAEYVDLVAPSAGHDACQSASRRWVEGLVPGNWAAPLHPNANGEAAYARIIGDVIADV